MVEHSRFEHEKLDWSENLECGLLSNLSFPNRMPFLVEKLNVYQKAVDFAEAVGHVTEMFPRGHTYLADQLNRAATSISANLAEGNGRSHKPDRRRFFFISRGSAFECLPLLELARRKNLLAAERHRVLYGQLEEISKMLSGLLA